MAISALLYGPVLMTTSLVTVFTSVGRTKITHVRVSNSNAAAVDVDVRISNASSSVAGYLHRLTRIPGTSSVDNFLDSYFSDLILENGWIVLVRCSAAASADVTIMGKTGV